MRVLGRLPAPLAHAAGAALGKTFYVLGGRGDSLAGQTARDLGDRRRAAAACGGPGRLPVALSDLSAVAVGGRVVVVGGRDAGGGVHDEVWTLAPR